VISFFGLFVMIFLAWLMSSHKRKFPWRIVITGLALQLILAVIVLKTPPGQMFFAGIGSFFNKLMDFTNIGSEFLFGKELVGKYIFAFRILPTIIFFSCLMSMLYYVGMMQLLVKGLAWVMQRTLGTSGAETLSASANIFLGQTEAPLVIKPYLPTMTYSELSAVMVTGFAGVSGGVLAAFVSFGMKAEDLVMASVISAPAGLLLSKVMIPETETPATLGVDRIEPPPVGANILEAAAIGTTDGLKLALNVAAMLIAFLALIEMCDWVVCALGDLIAEKTVFIGARDWSLKGLLGILFAPVAWVMGVEWKDCGHAGQLLGLKTFANEFVAYEKMSTWLDPNSPVKLQPRTVTIMTYALCGFSNFSSIGIQIGGLGAMAPERQGDFARLGLKAMLCGALATCMTACIAGVLI
jgi:CNT family concentrative nucleoside transporter